ncbi:hypothetical protein BTVI_101175 [Pitangus sulphuratus]|nr:hypothetical protein BTVI_101175 [Pitangus sulphuratus]
MLPLDSLLRWKARIYRAELDQLKKWGKRNKTSRVPAKRASALSDSITTATREYDQRTRAGAEKVTVWLPTFGQKAADNYAEQKGVFDGSRQTVAEGRVPSLTGMCPSLCTGKGSAMRSTEETISGVTYLHVFAPLLGLN